MVKVVPAARRRFYFNNWESFRALGSIEYTDSTGRISQREVWNRIRRHSLERSKVRQPFNKSHANSAALGCWFNHYRFAQPCSNVIDVLSDWGIAVNDTLVGDQQSVISKPALRLFYPLRVRCYVHCRRRTDSPLSLNP